MKKEDIHAGDTVLVKLFGEEKEFKGVIENFRAQLTAVVRDEHGEVHIVMQDEIFSIPKDNENK
jgi:hypothetical protein